MPWMPTPGEEIPIQRVPSGFPGPGGIGSSSLAQSESGGYHHGFFHIEIDAEAAERGRVLGRAGGDAELALQAHPGVEREPVGAAADDDDGAEARARDGRAASS